MILCAPGAWLCPAPQPRARPDGGKRGGGHLRQGGIDLTCSPYLHFLGSRQENIVLGESPEMVPNRLRKLVI